MTKIQKIREEVARIQLYTQSEVLKQVLDYIDEVQEEPVSEDLKEASKEWLSPQLDKSYAAYGETKQMELTHFDGYAMLDAIEFGAKWQQGKDSIPAEYLEELINKLSKQFPEVSFAKLSRIAVRVSRWQKNQDTKNKLPKVINRTDLDEYAYQCAYDMSNDWMIENPTWHDVEDACKLGANWQKERFEKNRLADCDRQTEEEAEREQDFVMSIIENEHRQPTFDDAIKYGMRLQRENMMKDATEAYIRRNRYTKKNVLNGFDVTCDAIQKFNNGDKVKVIVIKMD